jgi:hypothetical protein
MPKGGRRRKKGKAGKKLTPEQRRARREQAQVEAARHDVRSGGGHDPGWGTSASSMGEVKRVSEEAKLVTCPECGYTAGRHSRLCAKA